MRRLVTAFCMVVMSITFISALAATRGGSPDCSIGVASPQPDDKEGADVLVSGPATLPADAFLYVFARREGLALVWPQGGGHAVVERGRYKVLATLGEDRDKGQRFDVIVQAVDAAEHAKLEAWFKRAEETGQYPGIKQPPFRAGCGAPVSVTVVKTQ